MSVAASQNLSAASEKLEEDGDSQCNPKWWRIEVTWNELIRALDALVATLPVKSLIREEAVSNRQLEERASS
jgi:hypothetical protein